VGPRHRVLDGVQILHRNGKFRGYVYRVPAHSTSISAHADGTRATMILTPNQPLHYIHSSMPSVGNHRWLYRLNSIGLICCTACCTTNPQQIEQMEFEPDHTCHVRLPSACRCQKCRKHQTAAKSRVSDKVLKGSTLFLEVP